MKKRRIWSKRIGSVFLVAALCVLTASATAIQPDAMETMAAVSEQESGLVQEVPDGMVFAVGKTVGIKLLSDGVLVVGLSGVETKGGTCTPGRDCGLKAGDVITHINGMEVDTIEEIQEVMEQWEAQPLTIQASRGEQSVQLTAVPVENRQGVYQLGVWLRDSMAGIGTVTYYDPNHGIFAALGHGINDVDTAMLMPLESGSIMPSTVQEIQKGISGEPGELHGRFDLTQDIGTLYANTGKGVFGYSDNMELPKGAQPIETAAAEEIQLGSAVIRSNVQGDDVKEYDVEITHINGQGDGTRNMMIQVTDPELLELTGGIVQGMSGSPIIQNGKLVGAVTHVLVNDPTRGYGIFIENMMKAAG